MKLAFDPAELRVVVLAVLGDRELRQALRRALGIDEQRSYATVKGFAARWSVSMRTVRYWLGRGMPTVRVGRIVRIPVAQADAWVASAAAGTRSERETP